MAISYPVDVANSRWAVFNTSVGHIIQRNKEWPRSDGMAIQGGNPDEVWLLDIEHLKAAHPEYVAPPQYDSRLYVRLRADPETDVDQANNRLNVTYSLVARPAEERKLYSRNEEEAQFSRHFPYERFATQTALALGILITFSIDQQTIPPQYLEYIQKYRDKVKDHILPNRQNRQNIDEQIDLSNDPDMDANWTEVDESLDF
jgi:hypothetical protein